MLLVVSVCEGCEAPVQQRVLEKVGLLPGLTVEYLSADRCKVLTSDDHVVLDGVAEAHEEHGDGGEERDECEDSDCGLARRAPSRLHDF